MRHLDLFAGIGGFSLAASWMGWETVAQVEWDGWCQKVLAKNFPDALRFGDIKEFNNKLENGEIITDTFNTGHERRVNIEEGQQSCRGRESRSQPSTLHICESTNIGRIDIITGGFPCQPFSHAGKRKGVADERYLWPEMLRTIRILKPSFVVGENVAGLVSMDDGKTLDSILADLENEGYTVESFIIPACAVGAWHRRDRIWIVAHKSGKGFQECRYKSRQSKISQKFRTKHICKTIPGCQTVGLQGSKQANRDKGQKCNDKQFNGCNREWNESWKQWSIEPSVGRGFNGLPLWLYRHTIKGYGTEESYRRIEILRELWKTIPTQVLWQVIGGFNQIQKSEILFSIVCEYEKRPDETRLFLESKETLEKFVRSLWMQGQITGSSYRPNKGEQSSEEHTNSLQTLSRLLAHDLQENWQISSWEDGIPRIATAITDRVNRLKGLGNAIVPQVVFEIFKAIECVNY